MWRARFVYVEKDGKVPSAVFAIEEMIATPVFDLPTAMFLAIKDFQTERLRLKSLEFMHEVKGA